MIDFCKRSITKLKYHKFTDYMKNNCSFIITCDISKYNLPELHLLISLIVMFAYSFEMFFNICFLYQTMITNI